MRRFVALAAGTAIAAGLASWGGSATLPTLPADIKARGRLNVAVKCDSLPFGAVVKGKNVGFDVEVAQRLAQFAFGTKSRVAFTCVTTPEREGVLTSGKVDLVIATFSYTPDRDTRIDFSRAYYKATGRLLVKKNSPVQSLADVSGARVATTSGSIYDRWLEKCFPTATRVTTPKFTGAVAAWRSKRADALMWDDPSLINIASQDRTTVILKDTFLPSPYGIGMKQDSGELKRWVDARLEVMRKQDAFASILSRHFPLDLYPSFRNNVLRPKNVFGYAKGTVDECP